MATSLLAALVLLALILHAAHAAHAVQEPKTLTVDETAFLAAAEANDLATVTALAPKLAGHRELRVRGSEREREREREA